MKQITSPRLLYIKASLFVVAGLLACAVILIESPSLRLAGLMALAVWCFARAYYFAFYVVEHYVDGRYRFSGLGSFMMYLLRRYRAGAEETHADQGSRP